MGMSLIPVHLLGKILPLEGNLGEKKLLTLGVQDCYFTYDQAFSLLRRHGIPHAPLNPEEIQLTTGFKWVPPSEAGKYRHFIHQNTLFRMLGFEQKNIYAMDINNFEGADIVHDLNMPISDSLRSQFDLVYDGGTSEHVFSSKDCFFNVCAMTKVGGLIVNASPCDYINHGFVNFNAELFRDCFGTNGFEEIYVKYIARPRITPRTGQYYLEFSPDAFNYSLAPYYLTEVFSVYRKIEERPLRIPQQGFYKSLWTGVERVTAGPSRSKLGSYVRDTVRDLVDRSFLLSAVIRPYMALNRAKKVSL